MQIAIIAKNHKDAIKRRDILSQHNKNFQKATQLTVHVVRNVILLLYQYANKANIMLLSVLLQPCYQWQYHH